MSHRWSPAWVAISIALSAPAAAAQKPRTPTFGVETQLVLVDVRVTRHGIPVPGLQKEQFTLYEDGVEQPIVHLDEVWSQGARRPADAPGQYVVHPRAYVFVVDELHMTPSQAEEAKRAIVDFIHSGPQDGDLVAVVSVAEARHGRALIPDGRAAMSAMLRGLRGRYQRDRELENISEAEAYRIAKGDRFTLEAVTERLTHDRRWMLSGTGSRRSAFENATGSQAAREARRLALEVYGQARERVQATLDILRQALEWASRWRGRKAFILVSSGFIHEPELPDFDAVARAAQKAGGVVHFLDTRLLAGPDAASSERSYANPISSLVEAGQDRFTLAAGSELIALDSGGTVVTNENDLGAGLERIAEDSAAYYLLGYEPPSRPRKGKKKDALRRIEIEVALPDVEVRHRKGY
jgi:VWFA-related protein